MSTHVNRQWVRDRLACLDDETFEEGARREVVLGSTVDTVVREADCDVLVERIGGKWVPESIRTRPAQA